MFKKLISFALVLVLLLSNVVSFACETTSENTWLGTNATEAVFTDVNEGDWYYEAVMTMNRYGIISGYGDGTFKPLDPVSREEFALMMVVALKLELKDTTSSFADVSSNDWASPYIETAKNYITGYKINDKYYYKPTQDAEREDMAVALIRALGKSTGGDSLEALNDYADKDKVSGNLYEYVASAIYNNLMIGYEENGIKLFKPTATLKRAEAASLLLSVVKEEKIVFDVEEKVVMGDSDFSLELTYIEGGVILNWNYETDKAVSGYKVVASKSNENPIYPADGYAKYIQSNSTTIYIGDSYNNGDFLKFEPGEEYYFSITALAGDEKISSNVIRTMMPIAISTEGRVPVVRVSQLEDSILVQWNEISTQGLRGYKIVASKSNPNPVYSEDGYAFWITELSVLSKEIYAGTNYNGGDLGGKFIAGENYYISVTAVYSDAKIPGNAILITMPE